MLDIIRKRKRSWLILLLLGIGVLAFVMVGVYPPGDSGSVLTVAEVNGDEITASELESHYQRLLQTYQQMLRGSISPADLAGMNLRGDVLNELIQQRLLLQEARKLGLQATDDELAAQIAGNPAFQTGGRFNAEVYRRAVRAQGMTPAQFEAQQRDSLTIQKLLQLIEDSLPITENELKERYRLDNEQINLEFIRLETDDFREDIEVTDAEVEEFYQRNKNQFREPLKVEVEYITYPIEKFGAETEISDAEIEEYYSVYRDRRFREPEQVRFRQIFIDLPEGAPEEEKAKARERIDEILEEARSGTDFAELAKEHSDDPSAAQGGDMGFITRGQIAPLIENTVFALEPGELSGVVESAYGLHLFEVEEKRSETVKSLEEVRDEIVAALKSEKGNVLAAEAIEQDREKALDGVPFEEIAKSRGLELEKSAPFGFDDQLEDIGSVDDFYQASLSLRTKNQIAPIVYGRKEFYLIQLAERIEPHVPPLDAVREKAAENLRVRKARELANAKAQELLKELETKKSLEDVAAAHDLATAETGLFARSQRNVPKIGSLQTAEGPLTLSKENPHADAPVVQGDAIYILALKESVPANLDDFPEARSSLNQQVLQEKRDRALQRLLESLKRKANIAIHSEFI